MTIQHLRNTRGNRQKNAKEGKQESTEVHEAPLQWRHSGRDGVLNHQPHRLFGRRSKKTSKLRVTGLCVGNSPGTGEIPAQMASNAENVSIWWRHYDAQESVEEKKTIYMLIGA